MYGKAVEIHKVPHRQRRPDRKQQRCNGTGNTNQIQKVSQQFKRFPRMSSNQENIEEIVKQNVKKQLNQLTDQVYGKIEKKLQTERKRRGY